MKKWIRSVAVVCVFSQLIAGCGILPREEEFQEAPIVKEFEGANYGKTEVRRGDLVDTKEISAIYKGSNVQNVFHIENARVQKVFVKKGDKVKVGDVLVRYEIGGAQKQLEEAVQKIKIKETELRHSKELLRLELEKQKAVKAAAGTVKNIQEQYAAFIRQYETELKILKLEQEEAQDDISGHDLVAEMDGTITFVSPKMKGRLAELGKPVITISGKSKDRFEASTKYANKFKSGDMVIIDVSGAKYEMRVERPSGGGKLYFYPKNTQIGFENGTRGDVEYVISQKKDVLYLPSSTVYKMGDQSIVYVEDEKGIKQIREVETGVEVNHLIEIVSGLSEGEQVIANG